MEFKEGDYFLGMWFMSNKGGNFMLSVVKRKEKWIGEYRFRYFEDNKTFGSKDRKSPWLFLLPWLYPERASDSIPCSRRPRLPPR